MKIVIYIFLIFLFTSCANIVPPTGGDKDVDPPSILNITVLKNANNQVFKFEFDEYIQLNKWEEYFYISPPINKRPQKKINGKVLLLTVEDTLNENITYNFALNSCIKDNNEGNVLDSLYYLFKQQKTLDTLSISGNLQDSYTLNNEENAWIMLFNEDFHDSLIFKSKPIYIAKTNKNGLFNFPNLKNINYKIVALTGFDYVYNKGEKIAFSNDVINATQDSFISLFAFNPIFEIDSTISNITQIKSDSIISYDLDSIQKGKSQTGSLKINTKNASCILQLIQEGKVITEAYFNEKPYLIRNIIPGNYNIKYIADSNCDSIWSTGNWEKRIQPETVINYPSEVTIRANWDLELEWFIE